MPQVSHSVPLTTNATTNKTMPVEWVVLKKTHHHMIHYFLQTDAHVRFSLVLN